MVKDFMIHSCSSAVNGCKNKDGRCKRGYQDTTCNLADSFDAKGYPVYHGSESSDLRVVPYNPDVLLDWAGHINFEFCAKTYTVLYLYNYLFKGNTKVHFKLNNTDGINDQDEISLYLRGRLLSSMEAMWRVFQFQTYPASTPSVTLIKVKLPQHVTQLMEDQKICDLAVYLARPQIESFQHLKYQEFFKYWTYSYKLPLRFKRKAPGIESGYFRLNSFHKPVFLFKRVKPHENVVRMSMIYVTAGEIWYLRLLLLNIATYSFSHLKIVDGIHYTTFQSAAVARGLATEDQELEVVTCFTEAAQFSTSLELRRLFTTLTTQGYPTIAIYDNVQLRLLLYRDDIFQQCNQNTLLAENSLLADLQRRFRAENKTLPEYGLPEPQDFTSELAIERAKYDREQQLALFTSLLSEKPLTNEMNEAFEEIKDALLNGTTKRILIQGQAGSGKSSFAKVVAAYARSQGHIVLGCASTALAANVYKNMSFDTAHGLFQIPVLENAEDYDQEHEIECGFTYDKIRMELLTAAKVIIWDEISSQHIRDIRAVFSAIHNFRDKVLIMMGDAQQIAPVVTNTVSAEQTIAASIYCSHDILQHLRIVRFTRNLRLVGATESERNYAHLIKLIGSGAYQELNCLEYDSVSRCAMVLLGLQASSDKATALSWLFPSGFDPTEVTSSCILAATNELVDSWNSTVQELNMNPVHTLLSHDIIGEVDDDRKIIASMINEDILNRYDQAGVPPHVLHLKVDDICILLRHADKLAGFTNNARVKVLSISNKIIRVATLDGEAGNELNLPRFRFNLQLSFMKSIVMVRTQFPLRLAYSLTFNRSQDQEFRKVLVDITKPPFSHGHLYVALSRIRYSSCIRIHCADEANIDTDNEYVRCGNVVYNELINFLSV
jgi:ATP-dependent DNA helicase PIF1